MCREIKTGKIQKTAMRRTAVVLAVFLLLSVFWGSYVRIHAEEDAARPGNVNYNGYDVVFAVDNSRSMWKQQDVRNQALRSLVRLAAGADIRIGAVFFADRVCDTLSLTSVETEEDSKRVFDFMNMTQQDSANIDTNIGNALEAVASLFEGQDSSRKRIVILFSDGINENLAEDGAYTDAANGKTREWSEKLGELDASIYCVYLDKGRGDVQTLANIVNYYSDDYSYEDERVFILGENEISQLSDRFAKVFYAMQNNMRYKEINLDSSGTMPFDVPELGIHKIQIYLDGSIDRVTLHDEGYGAYDDWSEGSAMFLVYQEPEAGAWSIEVSSPDLDGVHGTIAFYADLRATAELVPVDDSTKSGKKGEYELRVDFYDAQGEIVEVDDGATAEGSVISGEEEQEIDMQIQEGAAVSSPFTLDAYGPFSYNIRLTYPEFVDLQYIIDGGTITPTAPEVKNMDQIFFVSRTEEGYTFSIDEADLFSDPEEEDVTVSTSVVQLNADNPVKVRQESGAVHVTVQDTGAVHFKLTLTDESGESAEVTVKGTLVNRTLLYGACIIGFIVALAACGAYAVHKYKKKKITTDIYDTLSGVSLVGREAKKPPEVKEQKEKLEDNRSDFQYLLYGDDDTPGLQELAARLPQELWETFLVMPYMTQSCETDTFQTADQSVAKIQESEEALQELIKKASDFRERQKQGEGLSVEKAQARVRDWLKSAENEKTAMQNALKALTEENEKILQTIAQMAEVHNTVSGALNDEITCGLSVRDISEAPGVRGIRAVRDIAGRLTRGFYKLDDVYTAPGPDTLGKNIGGTGIYVFAYSDDAGGEGLALRGSRKFCCRRAGQPEEGSTCRESVLMRGPEYELAVTIGGQKVSMIIAVQ